MNAFRWLVLGVLAAASQLASAAVPFVFINTDGPNEGLNDPTIVAPIGGNPGTTLGAQRLAALQRVGEIWGSYLSGSVPIRVTVNFQALASNVLASASPVSIQGNFLNAPRPNVWYPIALASHLAGYDLEPAENDIDVNANSNRDFYYGFDRVNPPIYDANGVTIIGYRANFLDTLLHEICHGLGFISVIDPLTGSLISGNIDIFSAFIYDEQMNLPWTSMTSAQRVASAKNDPSLVWTGPFSTSGFPSKLQLYEITTNVTSQSIPLVKASFGALIPLAGLTREVVVAQPLDGCGPLTNAAALAGKIALIRRGTCDFDDKALRAQQAGAVAVIFANNVTGEPTVALGDGLVAATPAEVTIPVMSISMENGDALIAASPGVRISISPRPGQYSGTTENRVRLHAPSVVDSGSSVSHWSVATSPDLLMEPFINLQLDRKLDLSLTLMKDIGWRVITIPFPYLSYDLWKAQVFTAGDTLTNPLDDPDKDGVKNLEEYYFGNNPKVSDVAKLPTFRFTDGQGKLVFTRSKQFADLSMVVEKSTTLSGFTTAVETVDYETESVQSLGNDTEQVTLRVLNGLPKLFLRLRINR